MSDNVFRIIKSKKADKDLRAIKDNETLKMINNSIEKLKIAPLQYGERYKKPLDNCYKMRVGRGIRIVYSINQAAQEVIIHVIDKRSDVYSVAYSRILQAKNRRKK